MRASSAGVLLLLRLLADDIVNFCVGDFPLGGVHPDENPVGVKEDAFGIAARRRGGQFLKEPGQTVGHF